MFRMGKWMCKLRKAEKTIICIKIIKGAFCKCTVISISPVNTKNSQKSHDQCVNLYLLLLFFCKRYFSNSRWCFFCGGHKKKRQREFDCWGSRGKAWHIWGDRHTFLPFYSSYGYSFFISPIIFFLLFVWCCWINKTKQTEEKSEYGSHGKAWHICGEEG